MEEFRWILLGLGLLLIAGIWWWGARRSQASPGNAHLREASTGPTAMTHHAAATVIRDIDEPPGSTKPQLAQHRGDPSGARDWGVPPFEPLNIRTADFDELHIPDLMMTSAAAPLGAGFDLDLERELEIAAVTDGAAGPPFVTQASPHELAPPPQDLPALDPPPQDLPALDPPPQDMPSEVAMARVARPQAAPPQVLPPRVAHPQDLPSQAASLQDAPSQPGPPQPARPQAAQPHAAQPHAAQPAIASPRAMPPQTAAPPETDHQRPRSAPVVADTPAPPQSANRSEMQRILTVRVCAVGEPPWAGADLLAALDAHGLGFGRYKIFHRKHGDGRTLFCAASLVEPGTFDIDRMPQETFRGLSLFAVLPGPADALEITDALMATALELAQTLQGAVQDSRGAPMTAHAAESLRADIARFQTSLSMT